MQQLKMLLGDDDDEDDDEAAGAGDCADVRVHAACSPPQ